MTHQKAWGRIGVLVGLGLGLSGCDSAAQPDNFGSVKQELTGSIVISGRVESSAGPVAGARVTLQGSDNRTAYSDASGAYSIPGLGAGSYQLSATAGTNC